MEKQIREYEETIVKLKRARNSLLNVSKLPPEVLGHIFRWNTILKDDFGGLEEGSHNFLLVCHHWFEVASSTPEVWNFWGNTTKDWTRWCHRPGTTPLDLVLDLNSNDVPFEFTRFDALQGRADQDTIRRIHLRAADPGLLRSIIASLTSAPGLFRPIGVESFILRNESDELVDISDFFAHNRFPKLQRLDLIHCTIALALIPSRVVTLTTLELDLYSIDPTPSIPQVLSVLTSNPALRKVSLFGYATPDGGGGRKSLPRASPCHLKELKLAGDPQEVFGILSRLDLPRQMDSLDITLYECPAEEILQTVGPQIRDYLRHRGKSQNGLGLFLSSGYDVEFHVGDMGRIGFSALALARMNTFMKFTIKLNQTPSKGRLEKVTLDLIAHVPREEVVYLRAYGKPVAVDVISAQLPNLKGLHFERAPLPIIFPKANPDGDGEIFPSLQYILLDRVAVSRSDGWEPLVTFLLLRAGSGRRIHSLVIVGPCRTRPNVTQRMVQEFRLIP